MVITVESGMTAGAVLQRLAQYGFWIDAKDPAAREYLGKFLPVFKGDLSAAAARLNRDFSKASVAIRRQYGANILWYSRPVAHVLERCTKAAPDALLIDVLNLHEPDSRPTVSIADATQAPADSVVLDGSEPVRVGPLEVVSSTRATRGATRGARPAAPAATGGARPAAAAPPAAGAPQLISAWPRLDAPTFVAAKEPFEVVVGLSDQAQKEVSGNRLSIEVPAGLKKLPLTVVLLARGVDAPEGWEQPLNIDVGNPTAASATFHLVGKEPTEPFFLTMIEARFVRDGTSIGGASRPLCIGRSGTKAPAPVGLGTPWVAQPLEGTSIQLGAGAPTDLTIELLKTDRNAASGAFDCVLHSPHPLTGSKGPYPIDLGQDAKTFAKTIVEQVRQFSGNDIVDNLLQSVGSVVADKLGLPALQAVAEVAKATAPRLPTVLLVSAERYVPWELALMQAPLDANRPPYLGAQVLLGRWIQEGRPQDPTSGQSRPPAQPPNHIPVKQMAVMVGKYRDGSNLNPLPNAEAEAKAIVKSYDAIALGATMSALKQLLDASLQRDFETVGADAVHFAGHGDFDPAKPESSMLFLSDGMPLSSLLFRSAKYGGKQQPLLFLNACMLGLGGELLGDAGGFPGNCLKGGFGGVLGALWEVDDVAAQEIAIEFWKRALPKPGKAGEPIGQILLDLRAKYVPADGAETTYLSYVFYGHPALQLERIEA